jgi:hypothetical protein
LKLDLSQVLSVPCSNIELIKRNQNKDKIFYSIRYSFNTVTCMLPLYTYFKSNRLHSQFKYFRAMKIKDFLEIRYFKDKSKDSPEYKVYKDFIITFISYMNTHKPLPSYTNNL